MSCPDPVKCHEGRRCVCGAVQIDRWCERAVWMMVVGFAALVIFMPRDWWFGQ